MAKKFFEFMDQVFLLLIVLGGEELQAPEHKKTAPDFPGAVSIPNEKSIF